MKITDVKTHVLNWPLEAPFQSAFSQFDARTHCLVEIQCDNGTVGWGECLGPAMPNAAIVAAMRPLLIGRDPLASDPLWSTLYNQFRDQGQSGLAVTALSGLDVALWDVKGKHFGVPVYTLLGGAHRDRIRAYATGGFRRLTGDRPAYLAEETAGYIADGFDAVKIKIGYDVDEDIAAIRAVRRAIGPDKTLMIDANHGYDVLEAIALGKAAADQDIEWFEEPVVPEDLESYGEVRRGQPIPVAGGETWYTRWTFRRVMGARAVDILQPDVCGVGGLSEAKKIADMAEAFGIRLVPHVWGTAVAIAAALHYLAVLPPTPPRHESREPWLEFDQTENPYRHAVAGNPFRFSGGCVAVPDGPGLGIEIDRDVLREFAVTA